MLENLHSGVLVGVVPLAAEGFGMQNVGSPLEMLAQPVTMSLICNGLVAMSH